MDGMDGVDDMNNMDSGRESLLAATMLLQGSG